MKRKQTNKKILIISIFSVLAFFLVAFNVIMVTIVGTHMNSGTDITQYSNAANTRTTILKAHRGYIYDRNGNIVAQDQVKYKMYAILSTSRPNSGSKPAYVADKYYTAAVLAHVLECEEAPLVEILSRDAYQVEFGYYGNSLTKEQKEAIEAYDLPGIEFTEVPCRNYPLSNFASYFVGFAQYDTEQDKLVGKMGVEAIYDEQLSGQNGYRKIQVNTEGYALPGSESVTVEAHNGSDVYLTLDKTIQESLEGALTKTIEEHYDCDRAWGAVVECETGKILAISSYPTFDLNTLEIEDWTNMATQYAYEPGSTMKTFTYAAAIDSGVYPEGATFDSSSFFMGISNGYPIRVYEGSGNRIYGQINNARNRDWGEITYDVGYRYSSNVGIAMLLCYYLSPDVLSQYLDNFGFFKKVNFEGFAEEVGVKNMYYPIEMLTTGFGQGSSVTMMQMLQGYTAIFNDGTMVKPYIVQQVKNSDTGEVEYLAETEVVGQPIKAETAKKVQQLMWDVVNTEDGTGIRYRVDGVDVIAKTGTAEVAGARNADRVISSVMLAFPADDPKIMVYYAFLSQYDRYLHAETETITSFVKKVAVQCGLTNGHADEKPVPEDGEERVTEIYTMENYLNHSLKYVYDVDNEKDLDYVILGNGNQVINQYPKEGSTIISGQKVFLLTSDSDIQMPDISGYTRKDVMALWDLIGLAVAINGEGRVISQSIPVGTLIYSNSVLEVVMEETGN